jgi:hypothetical protein
VSVAPSALSVPEKRCAKPGSSRQIFQDRPPKLIWYTRDTPRES